MEKDHHSPGLHSPRGPSLPGVAVAVFALLAGAATPLSADQVVKPLLAAVVATGASQSVAAPFSAGADGFSFQATYPPAGVTVTLEHTIDGTTWAVRQTWDGSGKVFPAPVIGGGIYRVNVTAYAGTKTVSGSGVDDGAFSGTYTGAAAAIFDVEISTADTTDKIKWRKNAGAWSTETNVTGAAQLVGDGISIIVTATTGHDVGRRWTYTLGGVSASVALSGAGQIVLY
jgi:hypothetical protein